MDKCREEFEAYIVTRYPKRSKEVVTRRLEEIDGYQFYTFKEIEDAWVVWQHQQAKVEELEEEFAEDERFLKEQIKDKDLKISNLEYQQGMDKELIQTLQSKSEKLQKRVENLEKLRNVYRALADKELDNCTEGLLKQIERLERLEQALKGEGTRKKIPDIYGRCDFKPEPLKTSEDEE
ncbi:hypothetical protein [Acinetobacter baumannii]|uniref:hypothetical protein n=1 Tax=Acinetobacter baumannii TaxID=470 RepID=UPI001900A062|nr:hypothetical protein [Acinetobacter baumannii]MBJ9771375.1 hypothetical protein [Acinetobacter baumannii]